MTKQEAVNEAGNHLAFIEENPFLMLPDGTKIKVESIGIWNLGNDQWEVRAFFLREGDKLYDSFNVNTLYTYRCL